MRKTDSKLSGSLEEYAGLRQEMMFFLEKQCIDDDDNDGGWKKGKKSKVVNKK